MYQLWENMYIKEYMTVQKPFGMFSCIGRSRKTQHFIWSKHYIVKLQLLCGLLNAEAWGSVPNWVRPGPDQCWRAANLIDKAHNLQEPLNHTSNTHKYTHIHNSHRAMPDPAWGDLAQSSKLTLIVSEDLFHLTFWFGSQPPVGNSLSILRHRGLYIG